LQKKSTIACGGYVAMSNKSEPQLLPIWRLSQSVETARLLAMDLEAGFARSDKRNLRNLGKVLELAGKVVCYAERQLHRATDTTAVQPINCLKACAG
jgi:hypothetical protein